MSPREFWRKRAIEPVLALLANGITPEKIVCSLALGMVIGLFPVLGSTTILCTAVALIWRFNLVAIQVANYLVYPLQLILLIPFYHGGAVLFGFEPLPLSVRQITAMVSDDLWRTIILLWDATLRAVVAWLMVAPILFAALYFVLLPLVRRLPLPSASDPASSK